MTLHAYQSIYNAIEVFNKEVFTDHPLIDYVVTLENWVGHMASFTKKAFRDKTDHKRFLHKINLNPNDFFERTDLQIAMSIFHECTHFYLFLTKGDQTPDEWHGKDFTRILEERGITYREVRGLKMINGSPDLNDDGHDLDDNGDFHRIFEILRNKPYNFMVSFEATYQPAHQFKKVSCTYCSKEYRYEDHRCNEAVETENGCQEIGMYEQKFRLQRCDMCKRDYLTEIHCP